MAQNALGLLVGQHDDSVRVHPQQRHGHQVEHVAHGVGTGGLLVDLLLLVVQHHLQPLVGGGQGLAGRDDFGGQALVFVAQLLVGEGLAHMHEQPFVIPRLGQKAVDGAFVDGVGDRLQLGVAGEHHAHGVGVQLFGAA